MEVRMLNSCEVRLRSGATQTFPKDWIGEVSDEIAANWIDAGDAEPAVVDSDEFTAGEKRILKRAAQQIADTQNRGSESQEVDLDGLNDDELRGVAEQYQVKTTHNMKRETIITKILAAAEAADSSDTAPGDGDSSTDGDN